MERRWCRSFSGLLILLLFSLQVEAHTSDGSTELQMQFRLRMNSGDHQGAIQVAQQLTRLNPKDGISWYVAHEWLFYVNLASLLH